MKQAMFDHYVTEPKKGQNKQCQLCNIKFGVISPQQHICKRCFRSVCDDCKTEKVLVWKDNFNQSAHKMCKNCKLQSDAIKSTIKVDRLMFASQSELAIKWKKSITYASQQQQQFKSNKNLIQFSESLLMQLWNSLTYSMKDFVGTVLGQKPQSKISVVLNYMNEVLNKINMETQIRLQTAAYLSLFLLCYCSPNTSVDIGVYLIKQLRNCQSQRQILNELLKDSNCSQSQIKNMEDYIDKKFRKFTSVLGINVLEFHLVQTLLQDMIQTPTSVVLCYASMLATQKKIILNKENTNKNIDFILLQQGDFLGIKKNYSQLKNKFLKKIQRKNSKKFRQQEINVEQIENINKKSKIVSNSNVKQQVMLSSPSLLIIQKGESFHFQSFNQQEAQQTHTPQKQQSICNIEAKFNNYSNQPKRFKRQKLKMPKIGSYMDLSKDFQLYLRSIKSLGLERIVSSEGIKQVHRIEQDYEFINYWQQQDCNKQDQQYNKLRQQYYSTLSQQTSQVQESFQINSYSRKYYQSLFPYQTVQQSISSKTQSLFQSKLLYVYSSIIHNKQQLNYFNIDRNYKQITPIKQNPILLSYETDIKLNDFNIVQIPESDRKSELVNNTSNKNTKSEIYQQQNNYSFKDSREQNNLTKSQTKTSHLVNWASKPITNSESKQLQKLGQSGKVGAITNQIEDFISKKYSLGQINKNDTQIVKKVKTQLKDTLQKQRYLQIQANQLRDKVRYYEKVLPQKQQIIMGYKNQEKQKQLDNSKNSFLNSSDIQSNDLSKSEIRRLQQRIKLLQNQNKKLENQKTKLESQSIFNNSSIGHTDNFHQNSHDLSLLSSRSVLKYSEPALQVVELKKELQLMAFTLKQKNNFLDTLASENKKLVLQYEIQKKKQSSKIIMCKQQYQMKIINLEKEKNKFKSQNEKLMDRLQEMTMKLLNIQEQLIEQNRKHFDYQ